MVNISYLFVYLLSVGLYKGFQPDEQQSILGKTQGGYFGGTRGGRGAGWPVKLVAVNNL